MKTKLFITGLVFFAFTAMGMAQNDQTPSRQQDCRGKGYAFVDENKNGICDNYEKGIPGQFRGNGKGYCNGQGKMQGQTGRGQGRGQGQRRNFVDANNNGVCDRFEVTSKEGSPKK